MLNQNLTTYEEYKGNTQYNIRKNYRKRQMAEGFSS